MAGLIWDLLASDKASPAFLRVAGAADKAAASTERATKGLDAATARMGATGKKLSHNVTLPLLAIGAVSVVQAAKYQKGLNVIRVATDQTAASMGQGSRGLLSIAKSTGTSLDQLTDSLYTATKSGQPMAKALNTVRAAAQGAKAEGADLGTVTNALTSIMASYGSKLRDPVAAMNMIVRGSGLAKTSLSDFAGSLSTVVPVAASLGIGFDQVAGAIDTMTQHGETAQHATDTLRNLITNLAGQNNVASASLQQLGVNTVDLSKNLGKRGLTGSLDIVLAAINKHGKDGMIVTSAFKQAATATASLKTELDAMPKSMQDNARAFDSGKMSYKDFLAYSKSLGGQQFAMAKNFLTTEQTAKGFNKQLTSGNGTVKTLASTLQKSLGGTTAMNAALQLTGESAGYFHKAVDEVGKSATATKGDVLGWATTQDTLATKMDKAKESLQVLAVELGSALIPAISSIADKVASAAHWFDQLSGTDQKVILWSAGILAAMGPLMTIGARMALMGRGVVGAFRLMGSAASTFTALAARTNIGSGLMSTLSGLSTRARLAGTALGAAGLGATLGTLTRNSSGAAKAMSAVGATAGGALIGFSAGGPIGAAVGAGVGLLSNLAANFLGAGNAAKNAIKPTDDYTQAILRDNDALGKNVRAIVASDLGKSGSFDVARKLGIDPKTLTDAVLGVKSAKAKVDAILSSHTSAALGLKGRTGSDPKATQREAQVLGIAPGAALTRADFTKLQAMAAASDNLNTKIGNLTQTEKVNLRAARDQTAANSTAGKAESARAKQLQQLPTLQKDAASSLSKLNVQVGQYGATLKAGTTGGDANTAMLRKSIQSYDAVAAAQLATGTPMKTVLSNLNAGTASMSKQAIAAGFNSDAIARLLGQYKLTPKQLVTNMVANISKGVSSAAQLSRVLNAVQQNKIPGLTANSTQGKAVVAALQARIDSLNQSVAPVVRVRDRASAQIATIQNNLAALHNKSIDINTYVKNTILPDVVNDPSRQGGRRKRVGALGYIGYSQGGIEDHSAAIYQPIAGRVRVFAEPETGGEAYIPLANDGRRPRARTIAMETVRMLGGVAMFAKGGTSSKPDQSRLSGAVGTAIGSIGTPFSPRFDLSHSQLIDNFLLSLNRINLLFI